MTTFTKSDELKGAEFVGADLRGARFVGGDLSGVWVGRSSRVEQPFHPIGQLDDDTEDDGFDASTFTTAHRGTSRCSRSGPVASRWCAISSPPLDRTN